MSLFALTNSGFDTSEGTEHYFLAEHIVRTGRLGYTPDEIPIRLSYTAPNGNSYGSHEFGNVLFLLPTATLNLAIGAVLSPFVSSETIDRLHQFVISFQPGIYSAVTATAFFAILQIGFDRSKKCALIGMFSLVFTSFFWTYSRNLYDGVLCGMLLTLSLLYLMLYKKQEQTRWLILVFIFLGLSFITRLSAILPIFATAFYLILHHRFSIPRILRVAGISSATILPFVLWQSWYNHLRTGLFYKSPVQTEVYAHNNSLDGNIWVGLSGLLLSPGKSIFIYVPLAVLSVLLFRRFYRHYRNEALYVLVLVSTWLLLHSKLQSWYGAWGWGPRHFISIAPILLLPYAVNIKAIARKTYLKRLTLGLAAWGVLLSLSSIISNWHFRMAYAREQNRLDDEIFVWGFWNSQAIDMVKAAVGNLWRMATGSPVITLATDYSAANEYVSSTLNIWPNAFIAVGIPWYVAIAATIPLWILLFWSGRQVFRIGFAETNANR
ncbi:glycosyltransferase family 39 protein [Baaleninema simplex]|uniref:glycosyltransferase family 39 protein n=1 Tax=Baaleninema simplex TaxID=2862350 RepID=UPI000368F143|nr:glycosyltransferase family 39 protein [Baaleninema simplex]